MSMNGNPLAEHFVHVAVPKAFLPLMTLHMEENGLELELVDDGEDDIVLFVAKPASASLAPLVKGGRRVYVGAWVMFLAMIGLYLSLLATGGFDFLAGLALAWAIYSGVGVLQAWRPYHRHRDLHAKMVKRGW